MPGSGAKGRRQADGPAPVAQDWFALCGSYYRQYSEDVHMAAREVLGPRPACEDVLHRVFLRLLENPTPHLLSRRYFRVAGRNDALNHLRSEERANALMRQVSTRHPKPHEGALLRLVGEERRRRVAEAIGTLLPRCRAVARRTWLDGWSAAEIAKDLGMTVKRVERHRAAARERLRSLLVEKDAEGGRQGDAVFPMVSAVHSIPSRESGDVAAWSLLFAFLCRQGTLRPEGAQPRT